MSTIVVKYLEIVNDPATGQDVAHVLGTEAYDDIEESLIPKRPLPNKPVFMTKKFTSATEYRWKVQDVVVAQQAPVIFEITLSRHPQLDKSEYLPSILKGKTIMAVLRKYAIVEVEFGHPPGIGKSCGNITSNKRYVDSVQDGNMPKRRLAIVLRATSRQPSGAVVQVVPISSVQPYVGDKSAVEVTSSLVNMVNYNKASWAVCGMVETVAAGRIIAPLVNWGKKQTRDTGFSTKLEVTLRPDFEAALLHGLDRSSVNAQMSQALTANALLATQNAQLVADNSALAAQLAALQNAHLHAGAHEAMARELATANSMDFEELRLAF